MRLKIRKPIPDPAEGADGLTLAGRRLAAGNLVYAVIALEAVYTEVSPEGEELAVVATVTAGEALDGPASDLACQMLEDAHARRTGTQRLPLGPELERRLNAELADEDITVTIDEPQ